MIYVCRVPGAFKCQTRAVSLSSSFVFCRFCNLLKTRPRHPQTGPKPLMPRDVGLASYLARGSGMARCAKMPKLGLSSFDCFWERQEIRQKREGWSSLWVGGPSRAGKHERHGEKAGVTREYDAGTRFVDLLLLCLFFFHSVTLSHLSPLYRSISHKASRDVYAMTCGKVYIWSRAVSFALFPVPKKENTAMPSGREHATTSPEMEASEEMK